MPENQDSAKDSVDANAAAPPQVPLHLPTAITAPPTPHYLSSQLNSRLDRTTVCLPIVHGSVAFYLGKRAENKNEYQSHQWTLYLRGLNNEDLSTCVEKVVFQLHPSFAQPIREYQHPPFEVTEKGWGEFEAQIMIHWKDPSEKMTMLTHGIKLYAPGSSANAIPTNTEVPVVSEVYDEIVFTNPNESFFLDVLAIGDTPSIEQEYTQHQHFTKFSDTADMHALLEAQKFIQEQLQITKERYLRLNEELDAVDIEIDNAVMPPPPTPPLVTHSSSSAAAAVQPTLSSSSAPASSKPRNTVGASKPRASTKGTTKSTGTKHKASAPALGGTTTAAAAAATTTTTSTTGVGGGGSKKAKTKTDNKSQATATTVAAPSSTTTISATIVKNKST